MRSKAAGIALLAAALAVGLLMPLIAAGVQDAVMPRTWPLGVADDGYVYSGTLHNRALALDAWRNASPAVLAERGAAVDAPDVAAELLSAGLLPAHEGEWQYTANRLTLLPASFSARYEYVQVEGVSGQARLNVTLDAETGKALLIEYRCPPETLAEWHTYQDQELLRFAEYWGYDDVNENGMNSYSRTGMTLMGGNIVGTRYTASVYMMSAQGLLMYTMTAQ